MLAALGALALAACSPVALLNALAPREGVRETTGLPYADGARHGIDVYAPEGAEGAPVVLFLYGGSWESGERGMYRFLGASLASAGVVCMVPDYRVWPEVRFPAFMQDAARALAWARRNAAAHGGDAGRVVLMGHSAGAQMATLLALDGEYLADEGLRPVRALRGVVGLAGPYDFLPLRDPTLRAIFGEESAWPASQPINHVRPGAPPMLLATGDQDSTVLPRNTARLAARLRASGNDVRAVTYAGIGHREILGAFAPALRFLAPVRQDVLRFVEDATA
ncbi:alpha/beta hydrolase [Neoroseomonas soli]|uniref:Alpha/beta hydrolase n=1 Tax=Neoroseomonas soli TaxID=1081025 RepID=A0A9X9WZ69_9PROT|nr:alpha/beta hydrolase [Neoroseomonas soli]MBR0672448.1 alpha/beta hydrolase [Neoroseomonas soli]